MNCQLEKPSIRWMEPRAKHRHVRLTIHHEVTVMGLNQKALPVHRSIDTLAPTMLLVTPPSCPATQQPRAMAEGLCQVIC